MKSNKRGSYSLLVLLFLKSKSTGTKASYVRYVSKTAFMYNILQYELMKLQGQLASVQTRRNAD